MNIRIRLMGAGDRPAWAEMRAALWPEESAAEHAHGVDELLRSGRAWGRSVLPGAGEPAPVTGLMVSGTLILLAA